MKIVCHIFGAASGAPFKDKSALDVVEERFSKKLALWKRQYLSMGGRLTLLKSILSGLPIYFMSLFIIPKSVAVTLERLCRAFLWEGGALEKNLIQ